ncbi:MAG: hypothetical protein JRI23_22795 [Deltaproteobacteria bacterium]|jgi:hypothetical protein|nr:hypothetical protein [Deltaproteobacteria bacterium]MBW2534797.1 hypothetical protein [Deltaproteobacteria bacterium]
MRRVWVWVAVACATLALGCTCRRERSQAVGESCASATACASGLACVEGLCAAATERTAKPLTAERIRECKSLIGAINTESAKFTGEPPETPVELLRMADTIKASAKRIGEVELRDVDLASLRDEYKAMAEDLAKAARDAGTAGTDSDKLEGALETMDTIGARENRLLGKINRHCGIG